MFTSKFKHWICASSFIQQALLFALFLWLWYNMIYQFYNKAVENNMIIEGKSNEPGLQGFRRTLLRNLNVNQV